MTLEELEPIVMELKEKIDNILSTADAEEKKFRHEKGVSDFTERNKESLGKYVDTMKKLNGDDFDLYSSAFDEYNDSFSDIEEATYVAQLVSEIDNKIAKLKEALSENEVEVKSDEETTEVEAGDTEVETEAKDANEVAEEDKPEEEAKEDEPNDGEAEEAEKEFIAELEADLPKYKRD